MQQAMLNTPNLSILEQPVNDIVLIEEPDVEQDGKSKLRVVGVLLGNSTEIGFWLSN